MQERLTTKRRTILVYAFLSFAVDCQRNPSATIDPHSGGSLTVSAKDGGSASLSVGPGGPKLDISGKVSDSGIAGLSAIYDLEPDGTQLAAPATLTITLGHHDQIDLYADRPIMPSWRALNGTP